MKKNYQPGSTNFSKDDESGKCGKLSHDSYDLPTKTGIVTIKNQQDEREKLGEVALWANYVNYLKYLSESNAEKKKELGYASLGAVTNIQTQACYNPQPKI